MDASKLNRYSTWNFYCDDCGLHFMQSFELHKEAYHFGDLERSTLDDE